MFVACNQRTDIVVPKEAEFAVAVAKEYAKTNKLIERPMVQATEFRDGVWKVELVSAFTKRSDLSCWIIDVSTNGQIVMAYGPH